MPSGMIERHHGCLRHKAGTVGCGNGCGDRTGGPAHPASASKRHRRALHVERRKDRRKGMLFEFTRRSGAPTVFNDGVTFHVDQISRFGAGEGPIDVSHLIDRSYGYHSSRELRWHLAERFGVAPNAVALREAH